MRRRQFIQLSIAASLQAGLMSTTSGLVLAARSKYPPQAGNMTYEVVKTDAQWREILSESEFAVLREEATEKTFSSPLNEEKRQGTYHCRGCNLAVYSSETKYRSGTGWPSFYDNIDDGVRIKPDNSFFSTRTEVHCRRCGGHFGHIFEDGPAPTGLRHCLNGVALVFVPAAG